MRVDEHRIIHVGGPIASIANAHRKWQERRGVYFALRAGSAVGVGEASPLPGYSPDTLAAVASQLAGLDNLDFDPASALASLDLPELHPSARFAVETAVVDLAGHLSGTSVSALLGAAPGRTLAAAAVFGPHQPATDASVIKVKIGTDLDSELATISELRRAGRRVRADANRSLAGRQLESTLRQLAEYGVDFVEEPAPPELLASIDLPLPIALDETLCDPDWRRVALALAERKRLAALIIKPAVVGGLVRAIALADEARTLGARAIVSHVFDGPVALAAGCELALAAACDVPQGLSLHAGLTAYPDADVGQLDGSTITGTGRPGLGIEGPWS